MQHTEEKKRARSRRREKRINFILQCLKELIRNFTIIMCRCHWWTRPGFTVAAVCCWFQAAGKIAPTTQDNSNGNRTTNRQARKKTEKKQQRNKSNEWNAKKKWWKSFNLCTLFETLYNKSCMQLTFVFDRYTVSCSCVFCCCCCCSQCFFPIFVFHFYHRSLMGEAVFFIQWVHGFFIWLTLCFCVL